MFPGSGTAKRHSLLPEGPQVEKKRKRVQQFAASPQQTKKKKKNPGKDQRVHHGKYSPLSSTACYCEPEEKAFE